MSYWEAIIIAIVEGLTEFLPVSSTGHMIIASAIMGVESTAFTKFFVVAIQLGAILSVIILYWKRFLQSMSFYYKLFVAFIPAVIFGLLFSDLIDQILESVLTVAISLFLGGIVLLFIDRWADKRKKITEEEPDYKSSFIIGMFQVIAMIPGVSRSAATIIGGLNRGLSRKAAAEFSFFLAVPTMFAATAKKLFDSWNEGIVFSPHELKLLAVGNIVAFLVAMLAIKTFIGILNKYGFKAFGYYRIIVGGILIILMMSGSQLNIF